MTEISLDVDFPHPMERIWRALSDNRLVREWFAASDLVTEAGTQGRYRPVDLPGMTGPIDVEIVEVEPHRAIRMVWRADELHTQVNWSLSPIIDGTRLSFSQIGFLGTQGTARRRTLRATYDTIFRDKLGAVLDRMAAGQIDLSEAAAVAVPLAMPRQDWKREVGEHAAVIVATTDPPPVEVAPDEAGAERRDKSRLVLALVAAAVAVLAGVGLVLTVGSPPERPHDATNINPGGAVPGGMANGGGTSTSYGPGGSPTAGGPSMAGQPAASPSSVTVSPTGSPTTPVDPSATPSASPGGGNPTHNRDITAAYHFITMVPGGYQGQVILQNVTSAPIKGWILSMQLPTLAEFRSATQADWVVAPPQVLQPVYVTLSPKPNQELLPNATVTIDFEVGQEVGPFQPLDCYVGASDCTGL